MTEDSKAKNIEQIHRRLDEGLALLQRYYTVEERPVDDVLARPVIGGRPHYARRFDIQGVGNLLLMTVEEAEENQLSSFVITPYSKNLPLFSSDYVYSGDKRFCLMEIYDLSIRHDDTFDAGIKAFADFGIGLTCLQDIPVKPNWYDDIRPVCYAKAFGPDQDDFAIASFIGFLRLFIAMEQMTGNLTDDEMMEKWEKNKEYADRLIDEGGVSTDLFTEALGAENTRRFFHEVFFGAECYKPGAPDRDDKSAAQIDAFLAVTDADGISNRQKIEQNQHIIRRTAETDKSKSYEDAEKTERGDGYPAGIVYRDGMLAGFGIDIWNEDIYPIKEFEIYFRNCGLVGSLDLSNCSDLLFVDVYHNAIEAIDVTGDSALRILGVQDNHIGALDVRSLCSVQGIDAGKNRLQQLDVSQNPELVELYINDNQITEIDLSKNPKLKYFYCHNNQLILLDTIANPQLRHLDATGNPMKTILSLAPQKEERMPLELHAEGAGTVGLCFKPVYDAQWKETGEWQQTYFAYPEDGAVFEGWYDRSGTLLSEDAVFQDTYGESRVLTAKFAVNSPVNP